VRSLKSSSAPPATGRIRQATTAHAAWPRCATQRPGAP
jgi:hypothetical protein